MAYTFQAGNNKINLLMEYESVTQHFLFVESVLRVVKKTSTYAPFVVHKQCLFCCFLFANYRSQ